MKAEIRVPRPVPVPKAHISANTQNDKPKESASTIAAKVFHREALDKLKSFIEVKGNISDLIDESLVDTIGFNVVEDYNNDLGSISTWRKQAEFALNVVAQDEEKIAPNFPFEGAANVQYPLIQTAALSWGARAYPEIIRGETVVGIKVYEKPEKKPTHAERVQALLLTSMPAPPQPQDLQQANPQTQAAIAQHFQALTDQAQQMLQKAQKQDQIDDSDAEMDCEDKNSRAERVAEYLNWLVFNQMEDWEGDTDALLNILPVLGATFKKVYMGQKGLCSEFVSAMNLTVPGDTKSLEGAARITHDFTMLPVHIEQAMRSDRFIQTTLDIADDDKNEPRTLLEQLRYEDLDEDGLAEPYLVTVDEESSTVLRIEPAYGLKDIRVSPRTGQIMSVDCYCPYAAFKFLPDPRGNFYGLGFGKLLDNISQSIDSLINQAIDANTAAIAGGGLIGSNVRLEQDGTLYLQPAEYKVVGVDGATLKESIYERTLPNLPDSSFQLLQMLIESAKEIASIKDVMSGEGNQMAAVGTTLAMQDQALKVFSAIYKRVYRGFKDEFRLMFHCLKRFATEKQRKEYENLTGGDLDEDFAGDGTDIQPVADPQAVSLMMKVARNQALLQLAESEVGQAAGMTQGKVAQELAKEFMRDIGVERPDRFLSDVAPNPEEGAKAQELQAAAQLKAAQAQKASAGALLDHAKTVRETALGAEDADRVQHGTKQKEAEANIAKIHADIVHEHAQTLNDVGLAHVHMEEHHANINEIDSGEQ